MKLVNVLKYVTKQNFILPFYHAVTNNAPIHLKHLYNVRDINQFENDLDTLLKTFNPISIDDLEYHVINKKRLPRNSFLLTFDDGLREFKENAYPIIKKKGIPVTIFVNSDFINNKNLFYRFKAGIIIEQLLKSDKATIKRIDSLTRKYDKRKNNLIYFIKSINYSHKFILDDIGQIMGIDFNEYLIKQKPYLTIKELIELQNDGVNIGTHSIDHPLFSELTPKEQIHQLTFSIKELEKALNHKIRSFSFPFTDFGIDDTFFKHIYSNKIISLSFGTAGIKNEKMLQHLQRIPVENYTYSLRNILIIQYLYYILKIPFFKNTIKR